MKHFLALAFLLASLVSSGAAQSIYTQNKYNISCAAATSPGVCAYFVLPMAGGYQFPAVYMWQTNITGSPSAVSTTFELSIDGRTVLDGVMTSGSAVLKSATATFVPADVGRTVYVSGAGTAGAVLASTVSTYTSATQVSLAANASTSISNTAVFVGTFAVADTATNTGGETRVVVNYPAKFARCNLGTLTLGTSPTVTCGFEANVQ